MGNQSVSVYSIAFTTQSFRTYLQNGGDPDLKVTTFFRVQLLALALAKESCIFYPFALFILAITSFIPIAWMIMLCIRCSFHFQPLICFAIMARNVEAVKLLVEHGANLKSQNIRTIVGDMTPLGFAQKGGTYVIESSPVNTMCCLSVSNEILALLVPKEKDEHLSINAGSIDNVA